MVDSDSDSNFSEEWENFSDHMAATLVGRQKRSTTVTYNPSDEVFEHWSCISVNTRKEAAQRMKVCVFWLPILLQREELCATAQWALDIGIINSTEDLTLRHIHKIETLEAIFRALENGTLEKDQTRQVFWMSNMFNLHSTDILDEALHWLDQTGEPNIRSRIMNFGSAYTCFKALHFILTQFAKYIRDMGVNLEKTMKALMARPALYRVEKSEEMKKKGNENFQSQQYEDAVIFYSKAIQFYPDNHIIYGNRALCYIRCQNYLKAVGDGKRAILIEPLWAKGHYRYCEALFSLGEVKMAVEANRLACGLCKDNQAGIKDLDQQYRKFITEMEDLNVSVRQPHKAQSRSLPLYSTKRAHIVESRSLSAKAAEKIDPETTKNKGSQNKMDKRAGKNERTAQTESSSKDTKPSKSEFSSTTGKVEKERRPDSRNNPKKKPNNKNQSGDETRKVDNSKGSIYEQLRRLVQDAYTALADIRSHNAEQAFSQALALLETCTLKELGLSTPDVVLLLYGRASALTEIGQPEELGEALRLLEKIKSYEERTFQCLVFYAIGKVFYRENRFSVALEQFSDALQMINNQIMPSKLTWPLTKEIVKETQPDYFKGILESAIQSCKFPPIPDAICRYEKCHGHMKAEIYFTDPDFKGFIQISCCQNCIIEYHITCWKTLKASSFSEKNEKDFLQGPCLTPDCVGQICTIKIFGPTGLVKCKFEPPTPKPQNPKLPKVNQKCTSLKLKPKEEHRLKRTQHKQSFQEKQSINNEILPPKEDSASQTQQKAWLLYKDRVLLQIKQNIELLREEKGLHVSAVTGALQHWLSLDVLKGNPLALKLLHWEQEQLETVGQVVEVLLERKNRVWARLFIQILSSYRDINPKLYKWAHHLNSAGLEAAKGFIERYSDHLEQLDLTVLLNFNPLQEVIIEKLGCRPEFFSSIGFTVSEYLKQAPPDDVRLFIWALEEHRDEYVSCHLILDEYFDMMDGPCSVLKKSGENKNNSPIKSRSRKKKQREPKCMGSSCLLVQGTAIFSGTRSVTRREEWDQELFEDDSLSFLDPGDPFSVPSHLRDQVADFENQYNGTRWRSHYNILENNVDPTEESLYDYFAQILEEHGPLVAEDPLLVGELANFPLVAQNKIKEGGGFEPFLLDSLRFIKIGRSIGLAKHAVSMERTECRASLDDLAVVEDPETNTPPPYVHAYDFTDSLYSYSSIPTEDGLILPNPYISGTHTVLTYTGDTSLCALVGNDPLPQWAISDDQQQAPCFLHNNPEELDLYSAEVDSGLGNGPSSATTEETFFWKHAAVQTYQESMRSVAVNTELHERFENCLGDINKKEKSNKKLVEQIKKMTIGCDKGNLELKDDLSVLKDDIQKINANIQVTNKELELFQQKLEEEVKKDQKEKKANQEVLRSLKVEIEELVAKNRSLARGAKEKADTHFTKLNHFMDFNNQWATKRMHLEDEIQCSKASLAAATRRSCAAQVLLVESNRDLELHSLYREMANEKALLSKLDEEMRRYSRPDLEEAHSRCRANIQDVEQKISTTDALFREQIELVKSGTRVSKLPLMHINKQPEPPAAPPSGAVDVPLAVQPTADAAAQMHHKPLSRSLEPPHSTMFDRVIVQLATMFPNHSRPELMRFLQELQSSSGGNLSSMAPHNVVNGVIQLILDHQEKLSSAKGNTVGRPVQSATPPLVTSVWQTPEPHRAPTSNALNTEDPCIICHEDMIPEDICVLECRHSFHDQCIRSWLKDSSTCPTCRNHALLFEDFPVLSGRRQKAP